MEVPPPPPGYLCVVFPITRHPISRENWRTFYGHFHIISTSFLGNFSHLTPIWETHGDPYSISFIFFGLGKLCVRILPSPSGALPLIYNIIRALYSPFLGSLLKARETCTYNYINHTPFSQFLGKLLKNTPYMGDWFKNTPFSGFSREDSNGQNTPFPEKIGIRMRPPCTFEWGGGALYTFLYEYSSAKVFIIVRARRALALNVNET